MRQKTSITSDLEAGLKRDLKHNMQDELERRTRFTSKEPITRTDRHRNSPINYARRILNRLAEKNHTDNFINEPCVKIREGFLTV